LLSVARLHPKLNDVVVLLTPPLWLNKQIDFVIHSTFGFALMAHDKLVYLTYFVPFLLHTRIRTNELEGIFPKTNAGLIKKRYPLLIFY
jgi:hypothetical protein